jgi:hypothetical protein
VGVDEGTPVSEDYSQQGNKFTGTIQKVTIDLKEMKAASQSFRFCEPGVNWASSKMFICSL